MLMLPNGSINGIDRYCFKHLIDKEPVTYQLKRINLEVTRHCNMNCRFCYNESGFNLTNEMTTDEIKDLIDEAEKMNVAEIRFTGGEALTRPDIFQLIDYTIDKKRFYISLSTNGMMEDDVFNELVKREINDVIVSVDGTEQTHNYQRPAKGGMNAYQSVISFINRLKEFAGDKKFKVIRINTVLTKITATEEVVRHLIELCRDKKLELVSFIYPQPAGRATGQLNDFLTNEETYQFNLTVKKLRQEYAGKGYFPKIVMDYDVLGSEDVARHPIVPRIKACPAGREFVFISPEGDVYPCGAVSFEGDNPFFTGNIRKDTLERIWSKSDGWSSFRNLTESKSQKCFSCRFWGKTCFGSCPITSWLLHRTLNGTDPYCYTEYLKK
jgi:radical SAM protein with 4Fe4S-binding SPASM domain